MNAYTNITGVSNSTIQYDNNGNTTADGLYSYAYNTENKLITVNGGSVAAYKYDALGRRIQKYTGGTASNIFYSGFDEIETRDASESTKSSNVFASGVDNIISSKINGIDYYFYKNNLGSINALADSSGTILERYEYDPFGKTKFFNESYNSSSSAPINNILYTGRTYDTEINKYYYRARHYEEDNGRFEQRDPLGYLAGDMNLYAYVSNMPTRMVDPFGTDCQAPNQSGGNSSAIYNYKYAAYQYAYNQIRDQKFNSAAEAEKAFQEAAFAYISQQRSRNPNDLDLAAAEHNIFARASWTDSDLTGFSVTFLAFLYDPIKAFLFVFGQQDLISATPGVSPTKPTFDAFIEGIKGGMYGYFYGHEPGLSIGDFECKDLSNNTYMPGIRF
jgi:RHS repeat-associated protein